jgi:putative membrane-bound dehydrogenase-like protein
MPSLRFALLAIIVCLASDRSLLAQEVSPHSTDPRLKIELFAESPQIVTPTGIDVDGAGRVWAIESNTHFPPNGYQGHPTDRILILEDTDQDGKADQTQVFLDGLVHSMSIAIKPVWLDGDGFAARDSKPQPQTTVFIATRREIFLCSDQDGDGKCDEQRSLVRLETSGNYPHNGLAGFAFDASGHLFFGFGENLGANYQIIGSDGTTLAGGGEGGNVYRCQPDGSKLQRWATGFWNPHASCLDSFGRLFTLDNDPDSRPPCRLLHLVQNGDYGYRFRNGRKGTHPFTSWNGEIPGTLPMVSGTGEAPSGIVCYESDGFPAEYRGALLVGSWGDHRIDKFALKERGVSVESIPQPLITGDDNFRPVGLAVAPDGSIFVTDWVSKEYQLHGLGRIWRISARNSAHMETAKEEITGQGASTAQLLKALNSNKLATRRLAAKQLATTEAGRDVLLDLIQANQGKPMNRQVYEARQSVSPWLKAAPAGPLFAGVDLADPFQLTAATARIVTEFTTVEGLKQLWASTHVLDLAQQGTTIREVELRQTAILLAARTSFPQDSTLALAGLNETTPAICRLAVQWVGEEQLKTLRPQVEQVLASEPMTTDLFMACLASLSLLDGVAPAEFEKTPPSQYLLAMVKETTRPSSLRAMALRMLPPAQKELDANLLQEILTKSQDIGLRGEVVRRLQHTAIPERDELLRKIAGDESIENGMRADAIAGLAGNGTQTKLTEPTGELLMNLAAKGKRLDLRVEAIRSLRSSAMSVSGQEPRDVEVANRLKQLVARLPQETQADRGPLTEALQFAVGRRDSVPPRQLQDAVVAMGNSPPAHQIESGRRLFFHVNGAGCYKCHTVSGRGGQVGPDLTVIARTMDHKKLAESILEPNKEISPQFTTWAIETKQGTVVTGLLLGEELNGDLRIGNPLGELVFVPFKNIETRAPLKTSIMPEKLHELMTASEFLDLIAYLTSLK